MKDPLFGHGGWRNDMAITVIRVEVAIDYHCRYADAELPVPGYHSLFGKSAKAIAERMEAVRMMISIYAPPDYLTILSEHIPWTTEFKARVQAIEAKINLLTASGQL